MGTPYKGFDRALDTRRPIGSLVKPIVYLTALQQPQHYTLATLLDDSPLVLSQAGTEDWMPLNYDHQSHGQVPLYTALAHSYNLATARLGLVLWQELARVRLDQGQYQQAEHLAAKSNALSGGNRYLEAQNWRIIGEARNRRGDLEGAREAFKRAEE